ncbi:hypothetical protein ACSBR2_023849 [Camellia fascicularis]
MGEEEMEEVLKTLPMEKLPEGIDLCFHEGHWYPSRFFHGIIPFQQHFKAQDTDLILVTFPKSGTTWLKALAFTIANYVFISFRHFAAKLSNAPFDPSLIEESFDMFCRGVSAYGPFWNHVLGYWKASQERLDLVLFLKYEDMKEDSISHFKVLAKFMGLPFFVEEESQGVIEEVLKLCSFNNLKDLDVNKNEKIEGDVRIVCFLGKVRWKIGLIILLLPCLNA